MQSASWIALLQRIPPTQHETLMLATLVGTEIAIQNILRLEAEYVVIRGRLAGSTDTGRVFFIPYDQLNYVGFQKGVTEAQICELYGEPVPTPAAAQVEAESILEPPAEVEPEAAADSPQPPEPTTEATPASEADKPKPRLAIPSRSGILARLRARTSAAAKEKSAAES
jgi:hypothetical protein